MINRIAYYFSNQRIIDKFTDYLMCNVNLRMIEYARGKNTKKINQEMEFQKLLFLVVEELVPMFTYKQWKTILSIDNFYVFSSKNKTEDIKHNLLYFLELHYVELYRMFDMKTYAKFQKRKLDELWKLIFVQDAYQNNKRKSALFILYKDEKRIGYDVLTKERVVMELLETREDTLVITLVQQNLEKQSSIFEKILNLF